MIYFIYNLFLYSVYPIFFLIALFSSKLRKNIRIRFLPLEIPETSFKEERFWFHAASVGEYEQIRPLVIKIKKERLKAVIYISVFSYSGYQQCYEEDVADYFFPLPFDFYFTMKKLIRKIKPKTIFYSRYDIWPNMARIAYTQGIQQILVSATLAEKSLRRHFLFLLFYSKVYSYLNQIFVIDKIHQDRFRQMNLNASVAGDTRYDSIQHRIRHPKGATAIILPIKKRAIRENKKILIAGSTYKKSNLFLLDFIHKSKKPPLLILAPHHTDVHTIRWIEQKIRFRSLSFIKYSEWLQNKQLNILPHIFLIDVTGILLQLYSIGDLSYIGGGWRKAVHSTIEPAFFKIPILTGPYIKNSQDALDFEKIGLIKIMAKADDTEVNFWYQEVGVSKINQKMNRETTKYIHEKLGAPDKIYNKTFLQH